MKKGLKLKLIRLISVFGMALAGCASGGSGKPEHTQHTYKYVSDGAYHYQVCTVCGKTTERELHSGGTATCSHKAVCAVCGFEYGELEDHQFGPWQYEEGESYHYRVCSECQHREEAAHLFNQRVEADEYLVNQPKQEGCGTSNDYYYSCICGAHSLTETFNVADESHDYSVQEPVYDDNGHCLNLAQEPDCTHAGTYYYVCSRNHSHIDTSRTFEYGEPLGHDYKYHHEETRTFSSYVKEYFQCERCGKYFENNQDGQDVDYETLVDDEQSQHKLAEAEGYGAEDKPFVLASVKDLEELSSATIKGETFEGKYFVLSNDITFDYDEGKTFTAIGGLKNPFSGNIDGKNHTISGLVVSRGDEAAFISNIEGGSVKNIKFVNVDITATHTQRAAAVAARVVDSHFENIEVISGEIKGPKQIGGIVAVLINSNSSVKNCINRAKVTSTGAGNSGGIVGATISASGFTATDILISGCKNYGEVSADQCEETNIANAGVGGIIGFSNNLTGSVGAKIENCLNFGDVHANNGSVGGIIGRHNKGEVSGCYSYENANVYRLGEEENVTPVKALGDGVGYVVGSYPATIKSFKNVCVCDEDGHVNHHPGEVKNQEPTSTEQGYEDYCECTICGEVISGRIIEPTGDFPHVINTVEDLQAFRTYVWDGTKDESGNVTNYHSCEGEYIKLNADLDLTNVEFGSAIASIDKAPFKGTFDGDGHTITGFKNETQKNTIAFFGNVDGGTIKNLNLANINITATGQRAAGFVARAIDATIDNCHILSGKITGVNQNGGIVAVSIKGTGAGTTISNCSNKATISASSESNGGICGCLHSGTLTISNCVNEGSLTGTGNGNGGILGSSNKNSSNKVVINSCTNKATIVGGSNTGGIAGLIRQSTQDSGIFNCVNYGNVTSTGTYTGGIVGRARVSVQNCKVIYGVVLKTSSKELSVSETDVNEIGGDAATPGFVTATNENSGSEGSGGTLSGNVKAAE